MSLALQSCGMCLLLFTGAMAVFVYGAYRSAHPAYKDPLLRKWGFWDLDGWSGTHFVLFLSIGFLFPRCWLFALTLGVLWEVFEWVTGRLRPRILKRFGNCNGGDAWWFGRSSDLLVNALGLGAGVALSRCFRGGSGL